MDYDKYNDKTLLNKPLKNMPEDERALYDLLVEKEAAKITDKHGEQFARSVAISLAEKFIKPREQNDDGTSLLN
jgi:hypothetical protein